MTRPRPHSRYGATENEQIGFSSLAPAFWRTAEKLRNEVVHRNATHDTAIPPAICLYHAALDYFINEEIAITLAVFASDGRDAALYQSGYAIQDMTLREEKMKKFFSLYNLDGKQTAEIWSRTLLFLGLRNRLYHHAPEARDIRDYPEEVIAALKDAGIEPTNMPWAAQCSNVRLGEWASQVVCGFIEDWCRARGIPSRMKQPGWELPNVSSE
jgi:hypothetical protein